MTTIAENEGWDAKKSMSRRLSAMTGGDAGDVMAPDVSADGMVLVALGEPHFDPRHDSGKPRPGEFLGWGWTVTLKIGGQLWDGIRYSQGSAHKAPPTMAEVMQSLFSDASGVDQAFEDWCSDYGYDSDSRKAEATYKACLEVHHKLRKFLGTRYTAALTSDLGTEEWCSEEFRTAPVFVTHKVRQYAITLNLAAGH